MKSGLSGALSLFLAASPLTAQTQIALRVERVPSGP